MINSEKEVNLTEHAPHNSDNKEQLTRTNMILCHVWVWWIFFVVLDHECMAMQLQYCVSVRLPAFIQPYFLEKYTRYLVWWHYVLDKCWTIKVMLFYTPYASWPSCEPPYSLSIFPADNNKGIDLSACHSSVHVKYESLIMFLLSVQQKSIHDNYASICKYDIFVSTSHEQSCIEPPRHKVQCSTLSLSGKCILLWVQGLYGGCNAYLRFIMVWQQA